MKVITKVILVLLLATPVFFSCGCQLDENDLDVEQMSIDFELSEDEMLEPFYVSETEIYASINKKSPQRRAADLKPGVTTEKILVYDYVNHEPIAQYELDENAYIYNAAPFEDGMIYSTYTVIETEDLTLEKSVLWEIKYRDGRGTKTVDSGYCRSLYHVPAFAKLDGEVYYLYEDFDANSQYSFGIKKASIDKPRTIVQKETERRLSEIIFRTNGKDFAILLESEDEGSGKTGDIWIGNTKGIYREYALTEYLSGFAVGENYLFCCTTLDGDNWTARSIDLQSGSEYTKKVEQPLYRITDMSGPNLTCVDMNFDMYVLTPGREYKEIPVEIPQELQSKEEYVRFYPVDKTKTLAQVDETEFYILTW